MPSYIIGLIILLFSSLSAWAKPIYRPLHSHNDYIHSDYLENALHERFQSIEVDVWSWKGKIRVSHMPWNFKGTLEDLYLTPLQTFLSQNLLDDKILLWIDIKGFRKRLISQLAETLKKYPMIGREVEVILTGNKRLKKRFREQYPELNIQEDTNLKDARDSSALWVSINWQKKFSWNGQGKIPPIERLELNRLIDLIHARGQKVRFYHSPDTKNYWQVILDAKVDLIDTDHVSQLSNFYSQQSH